MKTIYFLFTVWWCFFFFLDLVERNAVTGTSERCLTPMNSNVFSLLFQVS